MANTDTLPVTIYSTGPTCQQCKATYRKFDSLGVRYTVINLPDHPDTAERLKADGIMQAPYVVVPFEYGVPVIKWEGYRPDLCDQLKAA